MIQADKIIEGAAEILTCVPATGDLIGRLKNGSVAIAGEYIVAVGPSTEVAKAVDRTAASVIDVAGKIIAPGFVDCHTHLVFGGSRVKEYAARMTRSREEVEALGLSGGILATVEMTRAGDVEQLTASATARLTQMLSNGTTTVESKTGYGLTVEDELKMLEVNRRLQHSHAVDVVSTFLGAHEFPPEISREEYVDLVIHEMIPQAAERDLADFCDVYCDEGYYTVEESRRILEAGKAAGLDPKVHTDAYSDIGGAAMAAELGVVSADHLNYTRRPTLRRLARAGVVAVVMPALDFAVSHPRPFDARAMMEEGLEVALATDFCPACWVDSMQLVMAFACRLYGFSPEEALYAATVGGARALQLDGERGSLGAGKLADLQVWNLPTFEDVVYRIGNNAVDMVIKRGEICYQRH